MPRPRRDPEKEDLAAWEVVEQWTADSKDRLTDVVEVTDLMNTDLPLPRKREAPAD